jgi:hypothetical protein
MYIGLEVKCPLFLSSFYENCYFLNRVSIDTQIPNFMKIRQVGAELFHADRRTDGHEVSSRFSGFCGTRRNKRYFHTYVSLVTESAVS